MATSITVESYPTKELISLWREQLFTKPLKSQRLKLAHFIDVNSNLYGNVSEGIYFKGELFSLKPISVKECNRLNPLMQLDFKTLLVEREKLDQEITQVTGYFKRVFLHTSNKEEIKYLIPPLMYQSSKVLSYLIEFTAPRKFTFEQLDQFKEEHKKYLNLVYARIAFNFIDTTPI